MTANMIFNPSLSSCEYLLSPGASERDGYIHASTVPTL